MAGTLDPQQQMSVRAESGLVAGRYRLTKRLGEGTYGEVYRARDTKNRYRAVAIKFLRSAYSGTEALSRFHKEAMALELLNHPNIVRVFERGSWRGRPYIVMELVRGASLETVISERKSRGEQLELSLALDWFAQLCTAVAVVHRTAAPIGPIIHRDIKPANILIERQTVKLVDFGVAYLGGQTPGQPGSPLGTPGYTAPESFTARGSAVSAHGDVYALGVVLCQLLTLQRPDELCARQGATIETARPEAPPGLLRVLLRALAADPSARFADAEELLHAFLSALPTAAALVSSSRHRSFMYLTALRSGRSWQQLLGIGLVLLSTAVALGIHCVRQAIQPLPALAAGGVLLVSPEGRREELGSLYSALCSALQTVHPGSRCAWSPRLLGEGGRLLEWAFASDAALTVVLRHPDELLPRSRAPLLFALGPLSLATIRRQRGEDGAAWLAVARLLSGLASMSEARSRPNYGHPLWSGPFLHPEEYGEELSLLASYVRQVDYGTTPPGSNALHDPELATLQTLAKRCQSGEERRPWSCVVATYLYPTRASFAEAVPYWRTLTRDPLATPELRRRAHIRLAKTLCLLNQSGEALSGLNTLLGSGDHIDCGDLDLLDAAACVAMQAEKPSAGAEIPLPRRIRELAYAPASAFARCDANDLQGRLANRGNLFMTGEKWEAAEQDLAAAYSTEPHPHLLLNRAESLLHLPQRRQEVLSLLDWHGAQLGALSGSLQVRALFFRWLVSGQPIDARALFSSYTQLSSRQVAVIDPQHALEKLSCEARGWTAQARRCAVYSVLASPLRDESPRELKSALGLESQ